METFTITDTYLDSVLKSITNWQGSQMLFPLKGSEGKFLNITIFPSTEKTKEGIRKEAEYQIKCYQATRNIVREE